MPGVSRGDMNGYRDFEQGHLRTSSYANGYDGNDPYRREGPSDLSNTRRSEMPTQRSEYRETQRPEYRADVPSFRPDFAQTHRSDYGPSSPLSQTNRPEFPIPTSVRSEVSVRSHRDGDRGGYSRRQNGNGIEDYEHNSFEGGMRDGTEPSFEVDHLATYTSKSGMTHPEDGLTKLKSMESTTGIWTMRCLMIIESRHIIIIDKGNGDELERFPMAQLNEPTAVLKNDRKETYNNLVLFTIVDDPRRKNSASDMHIFQSVNSPAHDIVDEILAAKGEGHGRRGPYNQHNDRPIPPPPSGPAPEPPYGKFYNYRATHYTVPRDEDVEIRLTRDNRLPESSRFNDASQWIHEYNTTADVNVCDENNQVMNSSFYDRSPSPIRGPSLNKGSVRSLRTLDNIRSPNYSTNDIDRYNFYDVESQTMGGKTKKQNVNNFGTWSGRNTESKKGKKGKKWYKLGFSKSSTTKSKGGSENEGFQYSSSTLPAISKMSSASSNTYPSLSRRWNSSDNDTDLKADWSIHQALLNDGIDSGRDIGRTGGFRASEYRASYIHNTDMDTGQNEAMEKDVQLLNNCFDDIEKFVSRLQQAAEAYKELERRRLERGGKKRQRSQGDGMLTMRARPPPAEDFVDIFQKFKFAFNLLAKLKAHIHDPNAPELVHFLFTPLSLIYEASRDPIHGGKDLSSDAVAPLLLPDSKQLLLNCLTSKELELWTRLGRPWTLVKDEWHDYVPPYNPRFYNGWQPSPAAVNDVNQPSDRFRERDDRDIRQTNRSIVVPYETERDTRISRRPDRDPYSSHEIRVPAEREREDPYSREIRSTNNYDRRDDYNIGRSTRPDIRSTERERDFHRPPSPPPVRQNDIYNENKRAPLPSAPRTRAEEQVAFAQDLKRMGATIYEAVHERTGKNAKELNVEKGDIVQVMDKSRNWWKLKNCQGETGYAPYTILKEYQPRDDFDNGDSQGRRLSGDYSSYINGNAPPAPPAPHAPGSSRNTRNNNGDSNPRKERHQPSSPPVTPRSRTSERSRYTDDLNNELRIKMNTSDDLLPPATGYPAPRSPRAATTISQYSSVEEVIEWLAVKGFSRRCMDLLQGYSGLDLFNLEKIEFERLLGRDEGRHLDSLLTVQKNNAGYRTRGQSELRAILQRRKERTTDSADEGHMGARPSFMPETPPDYSPAESEASSDDFGDAGKTLRNLLERQRKKIQRHNYQEYN